AVLEGLDAVALDLPGFGVAPEPPEPWSSTDYAKHVEPVLDELAPGPAVVVGHSFGARVAVRLAAQSLGPGTGKVGPRPTLRALVLVSAPLAPFPGARQGSGQALVYKLGRALHRSGLLGEGRMEKLRRRYGSPDYRQASPVMRGVLVKAVQETARAAYMQPLRHWASAGGELELVWGAEDREASLAGVEEALAGPPEVLAKVTVVPGAGHLLYGDLVPQLREAVLRHRPRP
ncbi:MAG TPA: alpha/beta hydrolase, partial [Acidimicrobiales bacterium]|nr:alpha/beta hydrolase [Acidimicrobiales bacterium]